MLRVTCILCLQMRSSYSYALNGVRFRRLGRPLQPNLFDFYRTNFHEQRNKKWVPSLPKEGTACDDDAVFVLQTHNQDNLQILGALRLTRSKNDGM